MGSQAVAFVSGAGQKTSLLQRIEEKELSAK